ncbi:hypothetical protein HMN09_00131200 [Mycena chlorophos]|uniref:Uncharacterized protein n=1 Tax=Mycena chlorophos TaxID=658473 RepID=A0A8H6TXH7_MYCCL|nr:hypothetical protein HMN09_00131200 [Mycena chlorophos]
MTGAPVPERPPIRTFTGPGPPPVTHQDVHSAKTEQLKYMIDRANEAEGEKVMIRTGNLQELKNRVGMYYNYDMSKTPAPIAPLAPPTINAAIIERQWNDFAAMGEEWAGKAARGEDFLLLAELIAGQSISDGPIPSFASDEDTPVPLAPPPTFRVAQSPTTRTPASTPASTHPIAPPIPCAVPSNAGAEAVALASLADVKEGLERASGLLDVVEQLESGHVQRVRDLYGPNAKTNRGAADGWDGLRSIVNKRERLGKILSGPKNFAGDKDRFLAYFKLPAQTGKGKRKRTGASDEDSGYRAYRRIVEAWVWCKRDIKRERKAVAYHGSDGQFSEARWKEKWGERNRWEVWRAMGRETYVKPLRQPDDAELDNEKDSDDE